MPTWLAPPGLPLAAFDRREEFAFTGIEVFGWMTGDPDVNAG